MQERVKSALLESKPSAEMLNKWLTRFVLEARRGDSTRYPSLSIYQLLCGLLRHARCKWKDYPNFMDEQNTMFVELRGTCERLAREDGVGNTCPLLPRKKRTSYGIAVLLEFVTLRFLFTVFSTMLAACAVVFTLIFE